jgi:hypothetical protein
MSGRSSSVNVASSWPMVRSGNGPPASCGPGSGRSEAVRRRGVLACADRNATLRRMRADAREGGGLCPRLLSTAIGPAAYGHRLRSRQDFCGLVGCFCRRRRLCRRSAGGTRGHGGGWCPADPLRTKAVADWSGTAQRHHGDLVHLPLRVDRRPSLGHALAWLKLLIFKETRLSGRPSSAPIVGHLMKRIVK